MMLGTALVDVALGPYRCTLAPLTDGSALQSAWRALEERAGPPFFLCWEWIGNWLSVFGAGCQVLMIEFDGRPVGFGLLTLRQFRRNSFLPIRQLLLHQTGNPREDQIWIEYNGLLVDPAHDAIARPALEAVLELGPAQELVLSMTPGPRAEALLESRYCRCDYTVPGYLRDLTSLRETGKSVMDSLSSNTRAQLRRAQRGYETELGPLTLRLATGATDALRAFLDGSYWHRERWPDSGFGNPDFLRFHERLIGSGTESGQVEVYRLLAGDTLVGVFYMLLTGRWAGFYLQSVRPERDARLKPGLCGHYFLMEHYLARGFETYDFMGGDSQYKRQLASDSVDFASLTIHDGGWKLRLEDLLRRARQKLRKASPEAGHGA